MSTSTQTTKTFRELIAANKRNSFLLVVLFVLFIAVVAMILSLAIILYLQPQMASQIQWGRALIIGGIAGGVSLLFSLISYYSGSSVILGISGAKAIEHKDDPELFNVVEEMAIAAGTPMPKVYMIYDSAPNAFATGRDPNHAAVAVTSGLRTKLTRDELQGVIAHEMAHVRNYDIRLMLLLAVLIGTVVMLSDVFWQMLRVGAFTGRGRNRSSGDNKGGGAIIVVVVVVVAIVLAIVAPILARLIQMAVSREREYLADATAVELTRYPQGLANALRKISADPDELKHANRGIAHLYIANPVKKFADRGHSMFASHPPIRERIARLESLVRA